MSAEPTSPFRLPLFRAIWIASLCSNFGGLIQAVGASWMMTSLGASPQMIALVQASTSLPIMLLPLWAGAVADNLDRRRVLLAAQSFMLLVSALLATGTWLGLVTPWLLLVFTFLIGCGTAINGPAWQASVGDMVPRPLLSSAVAYNSMGFNIARSLGPAIGGVIVATAGAATAFLANAVSYIGLIFVLKRWQPDLPPRKLPRERLGLAMAAGVRYVRLSPHIRVVLARAALFGLSASALQALMPLVARDLIRGGPLIYGLLLGAFGLGAVGGAVLGRQLRERLSTEGIVRVASAGLAARWNQSPPYPEPSEPHRQMQRVLLRQIMSRSDHPMSMRRGPDRKLTLRLVAMIAMGAVRLSTEAFDREAGTRTMPTLFARNLRHLRN